MKLSKILIPAVFLIGAPIAGCAQNKAYSPGPSILPNTERNMKVPAFWISIHSDPDEVIMDEKDIKVFNKKLTEELKLINSVENYPDTVSSAQAKNEIENNYKIVTGKKLYNKFRG